MTPKALVDLCLTGAVLSDRNRIEPDRLVDFALVGDRYTLIALVDWWADDLYAPGQEFLIAPAQVAQVGGLWRLANVNDDYEIAPPEDDGDAEALARHRGLTDVHRTRYLGHVATLAAAFAHEPYNVDPKPWVDAISARPAFTALAARVARKVAWVEAKVDGRVIDALWIAADGEALVATGDAPILGTIASAWATEPGLEPLSFVEKVAAAGAVGPIEFGKAHGVVSDRPLASLAGLSQ